MGEGHGDLGLLLPGDEQPGRVLRQLLPLVLGVPPPLRLKHRDIERIAAVLLKAHLFIREKFQSLQVFRIFGFI